MTNQKLLGALWQYWNIQPKARLNRQNTYFKDHEVSNRSALSFGLWFIVTVLALLSISSIGYALFWSMI